MNPVSKKSPEPRALLRKWEIIEIGAVKLNPRYEVVDKFNIFIKPEYNSTITNYITKLTGIHISDVSDAMSFEDTLVELYAWIGEGRNRVDSWSNTDFKQIEVECEYKNVEFPVNITRWVDFQLLFTRLWNCVMMH